jgi:hypothetical protein
MYGHAHLLLADNRCACGRPVSVEEDGKRLCAVCAKEALGG